MHFLMFNRQLLFYGNNWKHDNNIIQIKQEGNEVEGIWEIDRIKYKLNGTLINRAMKASIYKSTYDILKSAYDFKEDGTAYVYISQDCKTLNFYRLNKNDNNVISYQLIE